MMLGLDDTFQIRQVLLVGPAHIGFCYWACWAWFFTIKKIYIMRNSLYMCRKPGIDGWCWIGLDDISKQEGIGLSYLSYPYLKSFKSRGLISAPQIPARFRWFQRNGNWQKTLLILPFLWFLVSVDSRHSRIDTRMFPGMHWNGMQPGIILLECSLIYNWINILINN